MPASKATAKPNWIKAKIRTARMTSEIEGPLMATLPDLILFFNAEERLKIIAKMNEVHERLLKIAAERDAAA